MLQNWDLILPPRLTSYNVITHKGWGRPPLPPAVYKHCMDPLGLSEDPLCNHMTQKPKTNIAQQAQRFSRPRGSKVLDFYQSSAAPAWRRLPKANLKHHSIQSESDCTRLVLKILGGENWDQPRKDQAGPEKDQRRIKPKCAP